MPLVNNFLVKNCESFRFHCVLNDETLQMFAKNALSTFAIFRLVKRCCFDRVWCIIINCKFTNFPLFHPSVNRHFEISIITSFHLYAVADWIWARLQTAGTRTIAIYLHSQIQKSMNGRENTRDLRDLWYFIYVSYWQIVDIGYICI
jgi:hypothetical protein